MVLGPYDKEDWLFMLQLKKVIRLYKSLDPIKYEIAIDKDSRILHKYITKVAA